MRCIAVIFLPVLQLTVLHCSIFTVSYTVKITIIFYSEVNGVHQLSAYQHCSKYLFFVFNRRKKLIQGWNNTRVSNDKINIFFVNLLLKTRQIK